MLNEYVVDELGHPQSFASRPDQERLAALKATAQSCAQHTRDINAIIWELGPYLHEESEVIRSFLRERLEDIDR